MSRHFPHLRTSADMATVTQGSQVPCLCTRLSAIPPPCCFRQFPFAFVLGFVLRLFHRGWSNQVVVRDGMIFGMKARPPFHLRDGVCDQAIALIVVERIEDTLFATLQRLVNVVESNETWLDQLLVISVLDVVVEFFWVEVLTRGHHAIPHKGYLSRQPSVE